MKFDTQNKLSMLIMNVLIGVDGLDLKLKIYEIYEIFLLKSEMCSNFFEIWHLEQFWIMNINTLLWIDGLDPTLKTEKIWSKHWNLFRFS